LQEQPEYLVLYVHVFFNGYHYYALLARGCSKLHNVWVLSFWFMMGNEKVPLYLDGLDQPVFSICDPFKIMLYHSRAAYIVVCLQISNAITIACV